jgi:hypothetical protein
VSAGATTGKGVGFSLDGTVANGTSRLAVLVCDSSAARGRAPCANAAENFGGGFCWRRSAASAGFHAPRKVNVNCRAP